LLVFADALTRSWKQVTKFRVDGAAMVTPAVAAAVATAPAPVLAVNTPAARPAAPHATEPREKAQATPGHDDPTLQAAGFVRDERGLRFVGEASD